MDRAAAEHVDLPSPRYTSEPLRTVVSDSSLSPPDERKEVNNKSGSPRFFFRGEDFSSPKALPFFQR
jgi:hypothetical protein